VLRVDRRLQVLDLPAAEQVTEDPREGGTIDKTLAIDAYVVWRVPDAAAVERFILTVGTTERARDILRDRFRSRLGAAVARMQLDDLVSDRDGHVDRQRERLRRQLLEPDGDPTPRDGAAPEDGIEIVDVRVRRLNYPVQVRAEIFNRIKSERQRKVAFYESNGRTEAAKIRSASEANVSIALADAEARAKEERAKAEAEADRILNAAISKDPDYYAELKQREIGDAGLDAKKRVWSTRLFDFFFPSPGKPGSMMAAPPKDDKASPGVARDGRK
jgi:membrane protease subunit HflC